jgi:hypothetical protein
VTSHFFIRSCRAIHKDRVKTRNNIFVFSILESIWKFRRGGGGEGGMLHMESILFFMALEVFKEKSKKINLKRTLKEEKED